MGKFLDVTFSGLYSSVNPFSDAPQGALEVADNVVLRSQSLIEPRRGYNASASIPFLYQIARVYPWGERIMTWDLVGGMRDYSAATGWSSSYGMYIGPDGTGKVRAEAAAKSLFFVTNAGAQVLDELGGTVYPAGIPPPPYLTASTSTSGSTWLEAGSSVAYRAVLCRYDANNNLIQSAPSPRLVVTNSVAAQTYAATTLSKLNTSAVVTATSSTPHGLSVGQAVTVELGGVETYFAAGTFNVIATPTSTTFTYSDGLTNSSGSTQTNTHTDAIGPAPVNVTVSGILPYIGGATSFTFAQLYRTFSVPPGVVPSEEYFQINEHVITAAELAPAAYSFTCDQDIAPDTALSVPLYTNAATGNGQGGENQQPPLARDLCLFNGQMLHANTTEPHTVELQLIGTTGLSIGSTVIVAGQTFTAAAAEVLPYTFQLYTSGTAAQNIENTARSLCRCVSRKFALLSTVADTRVAAYYVSGETDAPGMMVIQEQGVGGNAFSVRAGQNGQTCWVPDLSQTAYTADSDNNRQPARLWWSPAGTPWSVPPDNWVDIGAEDQDILRVVAVRSTAFVFKKDGLFTVQFGADGSPTISPLDPKLVLLAAETPAVVNNQIFCLTNRGVVYVTESGVSPAVSGPIARDLRYIMGNFPYTSQAFGVAYEDEGWYALALPASSTEAGCSQQYIFHATHPSGGPTWTRWTIDGPRHGCYDPFTRSLTWAVGFKLWLERVGFVSSDFQDPDGAAINCVVRLLPIVGEDPLYNKTWRSLFLSFKTAEFSTCTVGFDSNANNVTSSATKGGPPAIAWGAFPWGTTPWSVAARNQIIRVDVPQSVAVSASLGTMLTIAEAGVFWQLQAFTLLYEPSTTLVVKG